MSRNNEYVNLPPPPTASSGYAIINSTSNNESSEPKNSGPVPENADEKRYRRDFGTQADTFDSLWAPLLKPRSQITSKPAAESSDVKRYRRGGRKHVEELDNLLATYLNHQSLQQIKAMLSVIRNRELNETRLISSIVLPCGDPEIQVDMDTVLNVVNDDLQKWALGIDSDEQLDEAYFGPDDFGATNEQKVLTRKFLSHPVLAAIAVVFICISIALVTFIYFKYFRVAQLMITNKLIALDEFSCQRNMRLYAPIDQNYSIITLQKRNTLQSCTNELNQTQFDCQRVLRLNTTEDCVQMSHHWACCQTFCIYWDDEYQEKRTQLHIDGRNDLPKVYLSAFVDFVCPRTYMGCNSIFPRLLLRSGTSLNAVYNFITNSTLLLFDGPKKQDSSLLAVTLFDGKPVLLSKNTESGISELCKSRPTNFDSLDVTITQCWKVSLPVDISPTPELAHFKLLRISSAYFAVITHASRKHHIIWNIRFFELLDGESRMLGDVTKSVYACASAVDVVSRLASDRLHITVQLIEMSSGHLSLVEYSVRIPKLTTQ